MNIPWRRDRLPTPTFLGSLVPQMVKNGRLHLIHGLGRSHESEGGYDNTLQCSCLKNSMDRGAWQATVHGVAKSQMQLSLIKKNGKNIPQKKVWKGLKRELGKLSVSAFLHLSLINSTFICCV